jgi:hypothetical protein
MFLLLVVVCAVVAYVVAAPLISGELDSSARETRRDALTLWSLLLGAAVAILFQKRSADLQFVRDMFRQWLEVQAAAIAASIDLARLGAAFDLADLAPENQAWLLECRRRKTDLMVEACNNLASCDRQANTVARQVITVLPRLNGSVLPFRAILREYMGMTRLEEVTREKAGAALSRIHRASERVNAEFCRWLHA